MTAVRVTSPAPRHVWRGVLDADDTAVPSQSPEWLDCVCAAGPWTDASRLYERPGRPVVLPAVRRSWARGVVVEASMPAGWGPGGVLAPGGAEADDVEMILRDLTATDAVSAAVRPAFSTAPTWRAVSVDGVVAVPRVVHVLDLDGGFDTVWSQRFNGETRKGIRRAERRAADADVSIERGNSARLVDDFYDVYERWLASSAQRRALPAWAVRWGGHHADPRQKFELVARALGDACSIYVARVGGVAAAADFAVLRGTNAITWRGMADPALARPFRLNELLLSESIKDACARGCRFYEMGESGGVESLVRFKTRFGARPCELAEYRVERRALTALRRGATATRARLERALSRQRPDGGDEV